MPSVNPQEILDYCRNELRASAPEEANQHIRTILSSEYEVPEILLASLDFSTLMDPIDYPQGSTFHLRTDCPPEEELAIRVLLQIVRQRSYDILAEGDLASIERRDALALQQDRILRADTICRGIEVSLNGIQERLDSDAALEVVNNIYGRLIGFRENFQSNTTQDLRRDIEHLRSLLAPELLALVHHRFADLEQALAKIDDIQSERALAEISASIDNLSAKQHEAASFLASISASIPALSGVNAHLWQNLPRMREFTEHTKFLYALSQYEHANPVGVYERLQYRPYQQVVDVANLAQLFDARSGMSARIIELVTTYHLKGWRAIKGDGNCYYRSAIVGVLEQLVLCEDRDERQARFSYLAAQFQRLLDDSILQAEDISDVQAVVRILNDAATGRSLSTIRDLEQFLLNHDLTLVKAMRSALANAFLLNLGEMLNGLPLETAVEQSGLGSTDAYVNNILMRMGEDAQGPAVQACLLNTFLGANLHVCLLSRESNTVTTNPTLIPDVGGYAPLDVYLLFRPGHYDLLETTSTYNALRVADHRVVTQPRRSGRSAPAENPSAAVRVDAPLPYPKGVNASSAHRLPKQEAAVNSLSPRGVLAAATSLPRPKGEINPPEYRFPEQEVGGVPNGIPDEQFSESVRRRAENPRLSAPPASSKQPVTEFSSDEKPNYTFMLSALAMPSFARVVSVLLLLSGLALLGAASFGAVPVVIGVGVGIGCLAASLGVFASGRHQASQGDAHQAMLKAH